MEVVGALEDYMYCLEYRETHERALKSVVIMEFLKVLQQVELSSLAMLSKMKLKKDE